MKVAIVSPLNYATEKNAIGSVESLVASLVTNLKLYNDVHVTLIATGDSARCDKNISIIEKGFGRYNADDFKIATDKQIDTVKSIASQVDLIHSNIPIEGTARLLGNHSTPIIKTLHGALIRPYSEEQTKYRLECAEKITCVVPTSNYLRGESSHLCYTDTVYNGIDFNKFNFTTQPKGDNKGKYWAFLGRISPSKGVHYAIQTALYHGVRLKIAGSISSQVEQKYFDDYIKPYLGDKIEYVGVLKEDKVDFMGNASLVISPSCVEEAFGLVNVEALACGTPVLTSNRGAFPEIITNGVNGYLANSKGTSVCIEQMYELALKAEKLDRVQCRESVVNRFSTQKMTQNYVSVYKKVLNGDYK